MNSIDTEAAEKLKSAPPQPSAFPSNSPSSFWNFARFFVPIWTRIKFLFTSAFSEACECSLPSKNFHRSRTASGIEEDLIIPIKAEKKHQLLINRVIDTTDNSKTNNNNNNNNVSELYCPEALPKIFDALPELSSTFDDMSASLVLDTEQDGVTEIIANNSLCPFELVTSVISGRALLVDAPKIEFVNEMKIQHLEHPFINVVSDQIDIEFQCSPEESLCSSSQVVDFNQPSSLTVLGRLYTQLMNGSISPEAHEAISAEVMQSTIPRNLSNCPESSPPLKPGQLYSWERVNTSGLDVENMQFDQYTTDPESFVECLISDSLEIINERHSANSDVNKNKFEYPKILSNGEPCETFNDNQYLSSLPPICIDSTHLNSPLFNESQTESNRSHQKISASSVDSYMMRTKRSSSLKSESSPVGQKIVRFADSLGLDLESIHQVQDSDNPPKIPASATVDLNLDLNLSFGSIGAKQFQIYFPQPGASGNFLHRVMGSSVCLENARIDSPRGVLTGTIRLRSYCYEKQVSVRITYNNWDTFCDIPASYVQDSFDGVTDRFSFCTVFPPCMVAGEKAEFAIRYRAINVNQEFWDNNNGQNYEVACHAKATDMAGDGAWLHFV